MYYARLTVTNKASHLMFIYNQMHGQYGQVYPQAELYHVGLTQALLLPELSQAIIDKRKHMAEIIHLTVALLPLLLLPGEVQEAGANWS